MISKNVKWSELVAHISLTQIQRERKLNLDYYINFNNFFITNSNQ